MCSTVVIVTRWWLAWLLASVAGVMAILAANLSPSWLMAHPSHALTQPDILTNSGETVPSHKQLLRQPGPDDVPCLGLWLRCSPLYSGLHCGVYAVTVPDLHPAQVVSLVVVVMGTVAAVVACVGVAGTVCLRTIRGTSCFTIITVLQALAGVCIVVCAALFPVAWDSPRVQGLCGADAASYYPANCTLGWASYMVVCGGLLLLLCSCVSSRAAAASISSRVTQQIEKGVIMKVAVVLVLVGVVAVSAMPQSETTPEQGPMKPVTDEQIMKMVEMKEGMEHMMNLYELCMMKDIIKNCGCTGATGCEVLDAVMKCHYYETRGHALSKMMPENMLMQEPYNLTDEQLSKVSEAQCEMILPAPKHLISMVMKDDSHWHLSYVCMSVQNYEDQYRNCVVPAAHKYLRMEKKDQ